MLYRDENQIERSIKNTGVWETAETEAVRSYVKPHQVCIDVGANVGYFSLLMAKLGAKVYAYEPTAYGFTRLNQNLELNPEIANNIVAINKGLGDKSCYINEAIEARFSLRVLAHDRPEIMEFETLDSWWNQGLDFIKIDVDGHDTEVVNGARKTLLRYRPIVMAEFCDRVLRPHGSSVLKLAQAFLECGYDNCVVLDTGEETTLTRFAAESRATDMSSWNLLLKP